MSDQQPLLQRLTSPGPFSDSAEPSRLNASRQKTRRALNSKTAHYAVLVLVSLDVACIFADFIVQIFRCEGHVPDAEGEAALDALGIVSLVFSCLFMVEMVANIWASGLAYFRSKFHCFDALVICASFAIDVLLRGVLEEVASLVIVLRLWRVFKIIEELSGAAEEQLEGLHDRIEMLEKQNADMESEVQRLKSQYEA